MNDKPSTPQPAPPEQHPWYDLNHDVIAVLRKDIEDRTGEPLPPTDELINTLQQVNLAEPPTIEQEQ